MAMRKMTLIAFVVFILVSLVTLDTVSAADRDNSVRSNKSVSKRVKVNAIKAFLSSGTSHCGNKSYDSSPKNDGQNQSSMMAKSRTLTKNTELVKAILDYDDYNYIYRLYENKE